MFQLRSEEYDSASRSLTSHKKKNHTERSNTGTARMNLPCEIRWLLFAIKIRNVWDFKSIRHLWVRAVLDVRCSAAHCPHSRTRHTRRIWHHLTLRHQMLNKDVQSFTATVTSLPLYVVLERGVREYHFFFMFMLCHSNYTRTRLSLTRKSMLESHSIVMNTGT